MKNAILLIGMIILAGCTQSSTSPNSSEINSFEECAEKYPVMESYPRQCNTPDGKHFVEEIGPDANENGHVCTSEEKAAEICTKEYLPVCGNNGKTYGNKCEACASKEIDSYVQGACQNE